MQNLIGVGAVAILGSLIVIAFILSRIIYICPPNEVLIFSGGHRKIADNRTIGYRVVQGGRGVRIPLIEVVDRMDLTNMIIELRVQGAYSRGGIPLNVQGVANVKVSSKSPRRSASTSPRSSRAPRSPRRARRPPHRCGANEAVWQIYSWSEPSRSWAHWS